MIPEDQNEDRKDGDNTPKNVGPAKSKTVGKAGPGGGKPPKGLSVTPTSSKRGQSKMGSSKMGSAKQGPTNSANGTKQLKPKKKK